MLQTITTDLAAGLRPGLSSGSSIDKPTKANIMASLLEALTCPEHYQLIARNGELYVEPVA